MDYTKLDLLVYLLIYSFLGWLIEVCVIAVKEKRICNRGFFNLPVCLSYGIAMDILIILLPTMKRQYLGSFFVVLLVTSTVSFLSGTLAKGISRNTLWKYDENNLFSGSRKGFIYSLIMACVYVLVISIIHPVIFIAVNLIPVGIVKIVITIIVIVIALDFISIMYAVYRSKDIDSIEDYKKKNQGGKLRFGENIYRLIWNRIHRAYPDMETMQMDKEYVFARGMCFDKIVWIFLICAFGGDIIETIYCRVTIGVWMSRSSVIYGMFSIVWGLAAVLLTIVLQRLAGRDDRYVFIAGGVLGGVYEYFCSVFTEVFLGTTFWDYSHMPLNIGGRTNLLFCMFWGVVSVVWMKLCYPRISGLIERIPPLTGKITTWIIIVFMTCNALISAAAMLRYTGRIDNPEPANVIESFLDQHYDDELIEKVWPNMNIKD